MTRFHFGYILIMHKTDQMSPLLRSITDHSAFEITYNSLSIDYHIKEAIRQPEGKQKSRDKSFSM